MNYSTCSEKAIPWQRHKGGKKMAENTQLAEQPKRQVGPVQQVKLLLNEDTVKKRFTDVLGKKAPQFMASIVNVVSASPQLKQCDANSICSIGSV